LARAAQGLASVANPACRARCRAHATPWPPTGRRQTRSKRRRVRVVRAAEAACEHTAHVLTCTPLQWLATHPVPLGVTETEFLEREYWCAALPRTCARAPDERTPLQAHRGVLRRARHGGLRERPGHWRVRVLRRAAAASRLARCLVRTVTPGSCRLAQLWQRLRRIRRRRARQLGPEPPHRPPGERAASGWLVPARRHSVTRARWHSAASVAWQTHGRPACARAASAQTMAVHGHAVRDLLLAHGGSPPVQHQLPARWRAQELVWRAWRSVQPVRAHAAAVRAAAFRRGALRAHPAGVACARTA
jgi:hypothetical protein